MSYNPIPYRLVRVERRVLHKIKYKVLFLDYRASYIPLKNCFSRGFLGIGKDNIKSEINTYIFDEGTFQLYEYLILHGIEKYYSDEYLYVGRTAKQFVDYLKYLKLKEDTIGVFE